MWVLVWDRRWHCQITFQEEKTLVSVWGLLWKAEQFNQEGRSRWPSKRVKTWTGQRQFSKRAIFHLLLRYLHIARPNSGELKGGGESVAEHFADMCEVMGLIPRIAKHKTENRGIQAQDYKCAGKWKRDRRGWRTCWKRKPRGLEEAAESARWDHLGTNLKKENRKWSVEWIPEHRYLGVGGFGKEENGGVQIGAWPGRRGTGCEHSRWQTQGEPSGSLKRKLWLDIL